MRRQFEAIKQWALQGGRMDWEAWRRAPLSSHGGESPEGLVKTAEDRFQALVAHLRGLRAMLEPGGVIPSAGLLGLPLEPERDAREAELLAAAAAREAEAAQLREETRREEAELREAAREAEAARLREEARRREAAERAARAEAERLAEFAEEVQIRDGGGGNTDRHEGGTRGLAHRAALDRQPRKEGNTPRRKQRWRDRGLGLLRRLRFWRP